MSVFTIRTDVPMPLGHDGRANPYPWAELGVGHSFYVPRTRDEPLKKLLGRLQRACATAKGPAKYRARIEGDGVGVWRTE